MDECRCKYCGQELRRPVFCDSWETLGYCDAECCLLHALGAAIQKPEVARALRELLED